MKKEVFYSVTTPEHKIRLFQAEKISLAVTSKLRNSMALKLGRRLGRDDSKDRVQPWPGFMDAWHPSGEPPWNALSPFEKNREPEDLGLYTVLLRTSQSPPSKAILLFCRKPNLANAKSCPITH